MIKSVMIKEEFKKDTSVIKDATISSFIVEYPKKSDKL